MDRDAFWYGYSEGGTPAGFAPGDDSGPEQRGNPGSHRKAQADAGRASDAGDFRAEERVEDMRQIGRLNTGASTSMTQTETSSLRRPKCDSIGVPAWPYFAALSRRLSSSSPRSWGWTRTMVITVARIGPECDIGMAGIGPGVDEVIPRSQTSSFDLLEFKRPPGLGVSPGQENTAPSTIWTEVMGLGSEKSEYATIFVGRSVVA